MTLPENTSGPDKSKWPAWFTIAFKELGVSEIAGDEHNPRIIEYHHSTRLGAETDEVPWCSAFVCWCLEQAGIVSTKSAQARSYLKFGEHVEDPQTGDICVFTRGHSSIQGHVAFLMSEEGTNLIVLGGNQGDKVCLERFPKARLLAIRRPLENQMSQ